MVNLREKPYYLNDEQIQWVEDTIAGMTIGRYHCRYDHRRENRSAVCQHGRER